AGSLGCHKEVSAMSVEYMRWLFDVNVLSAVRAVRATVPDMKRRGAGYVLFTGSMASLFTGATGADYSSTKHSLLAVADSLRQEVAGKGIKVSIVCPAAVATNLAENTKAQSRIRVGIVPEESDPKAAQQLVAATGGSLSAEETARISLNGL